ncbi:MAG: hypothetical protein H6703_13145 [Myxococcales bacterium]|nr:hypothetical protein [Myxococcales bacterium]
MPPDPKPGAQLTSESEQDWNLLCELIDFTEAFALVFVFADDAYPARLLRERLVERARSESWTLRQIIASDDTSPADALITLLGQPDPDAIVWFEAMGSTPARRDWWVEVALRLNERREVLRRGAARVLCLVAPTTAKPQIREAASDLWSITTLMLSAHVEGGSHDMPLLPIGLDEPTEPATADRRAVVDDVVTQALALPSHAYRRAALLDAADAARSAGIKRPDLADALIAEFRTAATPLDVSVSLRSMVELRRAAAYLKYMRRYGHAIQCAEVSAKLSELWAEPFSDEQLVALSASLREWSESLSSAGRSDESLAVELRQIQIERRLTHRPLDVSLRFALQLGLLAERLTAADRLEEAEAIAREAVASTLPLTSAAPVRASLLMTQNLEVLAAVLLAARRQDEAAEIIAKALEWLRSPVLAGHPSSRHHRASTLLIAAQLFARANRWHEALLISDQLLTDLGATFTASHAPTELLILALTTELYIVVLERLGRIAESTQRVQDVLNLAWSPFTERPEALRSEVEMLLAAVRPLTRLKGEASRIIKPLIRRFEALLRSSTATDPPA